MTVPKEALLRVHAGCCNGQDTESLLPHYMGSARAIRDGQLVGEGPDAVRMALAQELGDGVVGRVMSVEGEPALVQWTNDGVPRALIRLESKGDRVSEIRIEHRDLLRRLVGTR